VIPDVRARSLGPMVSADLVRMRAGRVMGAVAGSGFGAVVACGAENVAYATGYRSSAGGHRRAQRMAAVVTADAVVLVAPTGDAPAALAGGFRGDRYVPYGSFFFDRAAGQPPGPEAGRAAGSLPAGVRAAVDALGVAGAVGVDEADLAPAVRAALESLAPRLSLCRASDWFLAVRRAKFAEEVELLRHAALLAQRGIVAAFGVARPGVTERQLAAVVAQAMSAGGGRPSFVVVTTGARAALSDVLPGDSLVRAGDLVRFDVGCSYEGYASDIARTAVAGPPTTLQADRYVAVEAGQAAQLAALRPGVTAGELFDIAVRTVEEHGLRPYRRHHCGHAIGMAGYETPVISPGAGTAVEPGDVYCLETPFYELGWGGMMIEDTVAVAEHANDVFTTLGRELHQVPA
jgi:Xaa-Pro dipeptidase